MFGNLLLKKFLPKKEEKKMVTKIKVVGAWGGWVNPFMLKTSLFFKTTMILGSLFLQILSKIRFCHRKSFQVTFLSARYHKDIYFFGGGGVEAGAL